MLRKIMYRGVGDNYFKTKQNYVNVDEGEGLW